jgi:uncharacterized LabA/DUF88 family protein
MTFNDIKHVMPFKANIFVDWLNVKANGGRGLNFTKLMEIVRNKGGIILRINIYVPEPDDEKMRGFYDAMKKAGFKLQKIESKNNEVNCDSRMSVDMVTQSDNVDVVYLLSNDSDFIPAVQYLQSIGKRVLLIHGDNPSNALRHAVDEWRHFGQLELV